MTTKPSNPSVLLARSAKLRLFVMLRTTVDPARLPSMLGEHLEWMIAAERAGVVVMSGPMVGANPNRAGALANLAGLTILRADNVESADEFARTDPFVAAGIVAFELFDWVVNEGAISVTLTLSDSTVSFG